LDFFRKLFIGVGVCILLSPLSAASSPYKAGYEFKHITDSMLISGSFGEGPLKVLSVIDRLEGGLDVLLMESEGKDRLGNTVVKKVLVFADKQGRLFTGSLLDNDKERTSLTLKYVAKISKQVEQEVFNTDELPVLRYGDTKYNAPVILIMDVFNVNHRKVLRSMDTAIKKLRGKNKKVSYRLMIKQIVRPNIDIKEFARVDLMRRLKGDKWFFDALINKTPDMWVGDISKSIASLRANGNEYEARMRKSTSFIEKEIVQVKKLGVVRFPAFAYEGGIFVAPKTTKEAGGESNWEYIFTGRKGLLKQQLMPAINQ